MTDIAYPVEYINGMMMASIGFITISGIILAVFSIHVRDRTFLKWANVILLISITAGISTIIWTLSWFGDPSETDGHIAMVFLVVQFVTMYTPLWILGMLFLAHKK